MAMMAKAGGPRRQAASLAALLLCGIVLLTAACGHAGTTAAARSGATPSLEQTQAPAAQRAGWPDDGAADHRIASTGCGHTPPVAPGSTSQ
ncbi:MAG TPA: hypothetical protein VJQ45_07610, partial [Ktedonobacterales bacterium]|nr:hypothetical protein [Ktedonobacterales bacterium]